MGAHVVCETGADSATATRGRCQVGAKGNVGVHYLEMQVVRRAARAQSGPARFRLKGDAGPRPLAVVRHSSGFDVCVHLHGVRLLRSARNRRTG